MNFAIQLLAALCFSATALAAPKAPKAARTDEDVLTQSFAEARRAQVKSVNYDLKITLNKNANGFSGNAALNVELSKTDQPLSIDLFAKTISAVRVNGSPVSNYVTRKGSFDLPAAVLSEKMRVEVDYSGDYDKDDQGFQRSIDPQDKSEYVFTDFEPYGAHRLFPCFDQPDIKATYRLTVEAPKDWTVISNDLIASSSTSGDRKTSVFNQSKPFSTYLFFLGAGPFVEWKDQAGDIPLYIYARKTLAPNVDHKRIMDVTKKGLAFFNEYFGTPYPFPKYGHVFIPEFAWGGMENPGAVTLNERNIFRGAVSQSRMEGRDELILHEMAHMWFGDLVTMKWWNDLWLNESFASYLASLAQARATDAKGTWLEFFSTKTWGYWQDQLVTTHAIETPVHDTRTAKGNFDGITYAKGASALKQLHFFVGEDGFKNGLQSYFKIYAFKNATRPEFTAEIAKASKQKLEPWTKSWLQTAGPNRVEAEWSCKNGVISKFDMLQTPSVSKTLAPHRTRVTLLKKKEQAFEPIKTIEVTYKGRRTKVDAAKGLSCPDFVDPNTDDHDYALFSLDATSLKHAKDILVDQSGDTLRRLMTWHMLYQMVRDTQLSAEEFMDIAIAGMEAEKDEAVLGVILGAYGSLRSTHEHYLSDSVRSLLAPRLEQAAWKRIESAAPGSDTRLSFFDFYVSIAESAESMNRLSGFLKGEGIPKGIELDQDRRWDAISTLSKNAFKGSEQLISEEEKRDQSTSGQRSAYAARASFPDMEWRKKFWADIEKPDAIPYSSLRAAAGNFHNERFLKHSGDFVDPFFERVSKMNWKENDSLVEIYFERLFPHTLCSKPILKKSQDSLKSSKNLTPLAKRAWLEANDELSRCLSVRNYSAAKAEAKANQPQ